jgi:hypothetical protein
MKNNSLPPLSAILFLLSVTALPAISQTEKDSKESLALFKTIAELDSGLFANIYTCNPEKNASYFTEDLEFYHDKDGLLNTRKAFMEALAKNFCTERAFQLKRELVKETLQVFPLNNYGAVETGEHLFLEVYPGKQPVLVGRSKFTNLWQNKNGVWKISRVISYDHQPAK